MRPETTPQLAILGDFLEEQMPKRAGIQKGRLKAEHGAWIGYWNEKVWDPKLKKSRWHRRSIKVCPLSKVSEQTGRAVKVQKWEAQLVFNETVLERMNVRTTNPPALATVRELWARKIEPQILVRARKTQEHWRNMMVNHILPSLGKRQLRDVRPDDVQDLIAQEMAKGASPQTVWHVRTTISSLFKRAKGIGWYSGDLPTEGVQMPRMRHEERQALTREQLTSLIENLKSPARELVAFLSMTGLRKSELQGLRWKRVNITDKPILCDGQPLAPYCIAIREQYLRVYGKHLNVDRGQWQDLKTREQGRRDVPLSTAAVELLRQLAQNRKLTAMLNTPVFASRNGTPINCDNVLRRHVKPVLIALGLPVEIDLHAMRHTQATLADQAGVTGAERQRILGHASQKMTQRYTHAELERVRPAMETASEGIGEALRKPAAKVVTIRKARKAG
jgi:integrase